MEVVGWIAVGVTFGLIVLIRWGRSAGGEWFSGYLIEYSLSIDNVFVWSLILTYFAVPPMYQRRVLFWGIFGALLLRAGFIFAGIALIRRFDWTLFVFGGFLVFTAFRLLVSGEQAHIEPAHSPTLRLLRRVIPMTNELHGQHLFVRDTQHAAPLLATPLFAVLVLVETTDVLFAVDSVPAVLAVSKEQFIVFTSNAFAIMGLRALYFLLSGMRERFEFLQQGLAVILAFVGIKMILEARDWYSIPTPVSLLVIALVLVCSVAFSLKKTGSAG